MIMILAETCAEGGAFAVGITLGFLSGAFIALKCEEVEWRRNAASRGVAEYYLDKNNKRKWRWLHPRQKSLDDDPNE